MQRRHPSRIIRSGLILVFFFATVLALIVFSQGPSWISKRFNSIHHTITPLIAPSSAALHRSLTVADLHADSLLWGRDLSKLANDGHVDVPRLIQGNVALQTFTVVTKVPTPLKLEGNSAHSDAITKLAILQRWPIPTWFSLKARALYQAQQLAALEKKAASHFRLIQTADDLNTYLAQRRDQPAITAGLLGLEGAQALEGKVENLDRLYEAGFRLIGLAHFFDNQVSGSAHGLNQGGLTPLGQQVIQRMADLNMVVDLAHASSQTIDDVLELSQGPVLVSHTGVQGTCDNARNLSDRQLQQIAEDRWCHWHWILGNGNMWTGC